MKLIANIESHGSAGYVGWIDSIKGLVVEGSTVEETLKELYISIKVKLAYDFGVPASELKEISEAEYQDIKRKAVLQDKTEKTCKKEINVTLC